NPWIQANISEINFPNNILTLLDKTDILLDISQGCSPPRQISIPVKEYFKMVKHYTVASDVNDNEAYFREYFLRRLSPDGQLEVRRYGLEIPLDELVDKLSGIKNIRKI
ncbi:2830_t:CDS:1, partial [Acaulospora colombiana]